MSESFDAIVVGTGISGGWAAKELTERGLSVALLERGQAIEHGRDYVGEHVPPWQFKYRGMGDRQRFEREYASQGATYAMNEDNLHFWATDSDWPYQVEGESPFRWTRPAVLGGRSLVWGRQVYRFSDLDFEANARDGHGVDWPIRYGDIASWYDHVERFIGVSGQREGIAHLPDGVFQPPMAMTCVEELLKERVESGFDKRKVTIGRVAVLTESKPGRAACHYCGPCHRGCSTGSYFSTLSSTLPAAKATGRLTLFTDTLVERLTLDASTGRARGVAVVDTKSHVRKELRARVVFLCASALGSTQILLNSATDEHPNGLGNSSGALGHYMMDHCATNGATGVHFGFTDRGTAGKRPNGIYIPRFRNVDDEDADFLRGYGYQGVSDRAGWTRFVSTPGFGKSLKDQLGQHGPWYMRLTGFGECLPRYDNAVALDRTHHDRWGIPQLKIAFQFGDNERKMAKDMAEQAAAMLGAAGFVGVSPFMEMSDAIHEMGTARMGRDPRESVLNAHNQCHDVRNVYVTDGACMTSSSCVNPSLTYMALTARAAAHAADELARGAL